MKKLILLILISIISILAMSVSSLIIPLNDTCGKDSMLSANGGAEVNNYGGNPMNLLNNDWYGEGSPYSYNALVFKVNLTEGCVDTALLNSIVDNITYAEFNITRRFTEDSDWYGSIGYELLLFNRSWEENTLEESEGNISFNSLDDENYFSQAGGIRGVDFLDYDFMRGLIPYKSDNAEYNEEEDASREVVSIGRNSDVFKSVVQGWINGSYTNYGFMLNATGENGDFEESYWIKNKGNFYMKESSYDNTEAYLYIAYEGENLPPVIEWDSLEPLNNSIINITDDIKFYYDVSDPNDDVVGCCLRNDYGWYSCTDAVQNDPMQYFTYALSVYEEDYPYIQKNYTWWYECYDKDEESNPMIYVNSTFKDVEVDTGTAPIIPPTVYTASDLPNIAIDSIAETGVSFKTFIPLFMIGLLAVGILQAVLIIRSRIFK